MNTEVGTTRRYGCANNRTFYHAASPLPLLRASDASSTSGTFPAKATKTPDPVPTRVCEQFSALLRTHHKAVMPRSNRLYLLFRSACLWHNPPAKRQTLFEVEPSPHRECYTPKNV